MSTLHQTDFGEMIGRGIAKHRKRCGFTQEEVAERVQVGIEAISRIERGVAVPTLSRLFQLADVFGCDAAELLTEVSHRPQDQASKLARMIASLSSPDQKLIMGIVEQLVDRLQES